MNNYIEKLISEEDEAKFKFDVLSSADVGILNGYFSNSTIERNMPKIHMLACEMPCYSRYIFQDQREINYHICGYDDNIFGALIRMCGESVERYAGFMAHSLTEENEIIYSSYMELLNENKKVIDIKYINVFSEKTQKELNVFSKEFSDTKLSFEDKIWWVSVYSALDEKHVYLPCQMFFSGFPSNVRNEKRYILSMSTGTAAHIDDKKALRNALLESIQINEFNLNWYFGKKAFKLTLDDIKIKEKINRLIDGCNDIELNFYLYKSDDVDLPIIGCFVVGKNKSYPSFSFGIQCDQDKTVAVERAAMEALSVYNSCYYSYIFDELNKNEKKCKLDDDCKYYDLDKNVKYYANLNNFEKNKFEISKRFEEEILFSSLDDTKTANLSVDNLIKMILKSLRLSNKDVYIRNITPVEIKSYYSVIRIFIPQYLPVFLPSAVYDNHPEVKGLSIDEHIHPLA